MLELENKLDTYHDIEVSVVTNQRKMKMVEDFIPSEPIKDLEPEITPRAKEILGKRNQLLRELLSSGGLDPFFRHNTSPRKQMFTNNLTQFITFKGATERYTQTGMEREFGKYTFKVEAPADIEILKVIERYPVSYGQDRIATNPQTIAIYEDSATGEVGYIDIVRHCTNHPHFGFDYREGPGLKDLRYRGSVPKGTVFLDSHGVTENGGYKYGIEANVLQATLPGVSEDGFLVSESFTKKLEFQTYEHRVVEFGPQYIPVGLYSKDGQFRICPDIGEKVREDGLLMALRGFDENTAVYDQSYHGLREYQHGYDRGTYVPVGGTVVDIIVHHDPLSKQARVPFGMDEQLKKYSIAKINFHKDIVSEYRRLKRLRGDALRLRPDFHRLVVESIAITDPTEDNRVSRIYRKARLDDWRVEFIIRYDNVPNIGAKLTGAHGNKGVVVKVVPDEDMPVDDFGNRADIVVDPLATVGRSILGAVYEPKLNAVFRDLCLRIRERLGIDPEIKTVPESLLKVKNSDGKVDREFEYLLGFYRIVSPDKMYVWYAEQSNHQQQLEHLASVLSGNRFIYLPPDNEVESHEMVEQLNQYYPNNLSPVTYRGNSGQIVRTKNPMLIASAYILLLDKTGEDWAAISSGRLNHTGVLAQINNVYKHSSQIRLQPTRVWGESEMRIMSSYTPWFVTAEIMDRNSNKETMEEVTRQLLYSPRPGNIQSIIDRSKIPYGNTRPLQIVRHTAECQGWRFVYQPYQPNPKPR